MYVHLYNIMSYLFLIILYIFYLHIVVFCVIMYKWDIICLSVKFLHSKISRLFLFLLNLWIIFGNTISYCPTSRKICTTSIYFWSTYMKIINDKITQKMFLIMEEKKGRSGLGKYITNKSRFCGIIDFISNNFILNYKLVKFQLIFVEYSKRWSKS